MMSGNRCPFGDGTVRLISDWSGLPVVAGDVDVDLGDCRTEEHFVVVLTELATEDVHVELQFDVLRSFYGQQQLNHRLVVAHLSLSSSSDHHHHHHHHHHHQNVIWLDKYMDLYSALDDKYLVLKALEHGSHSLTCEQHLVCL